jgi:hypothetical protein
LSIVTDAQETAVDLYPIAIQRSVDGACWEPLFWMSGPYERPESVGVSRQTVDGTQGLFLGILFSGGGYIYCPLPDLRGVVRIFGPRKGGFSKVIPLDQIDIGWSIAWELVPELIRCV